jgi:hypothetical protein
MLVSVVRSGKIISPPDCGRLQPDQARQAIPAMAGIPECAISGCRYSLTPIRLSTKLTGTKDRYVLHQIIR